MEENKNSQEPFSVLPRNLFEVIQKHGMMKRPKQESSKEK